MCICILCTIGYFNNSVASTGTKREKSRGLRRYAAVQVRFSRLFSFLLNSVISLFCSLLTTGLEQSKRKYQSRVRRLEQRLVDQLIKTDNMSGVSSRCSSTKSSKSEKQIC